jgi:hypothetical protein
MSELDREKEWIMEQMAAAHNSINDEVNIRHVLAALWSKRID